MQKILATLAILFMAACGSASQQTGPKTTNPPLTADQKAKSGGEKPPVENDGLKLKFNILDFQITMTPSPWKGKIAQQPNGSVHIVLSRPDVPAALVILPIKAEKTDAKSFAEEQQKNGASEGMTVTPVVAESNGRYAFTADATVQGSSVRTYVGIVPHPTIKDAYLVFMASCDPKDADAFFKEVRAVADSVSPIQ